VDVLQASCGPVLAGGERAASVYEGKRDLTTAICQITRQTHVNFNQMLPCAWGSSFGGNARRMNP
jgi:hypothetical protein